MDYHYIRQLLRIGADGRVHLQPRTRREGALVEIVKDISHDLMHKAPRSRAEPMHVLLAAVQFGYAKKSPMTTDSGTILSLVLIQVREVGSFSVKEASIRLSG